MRVALALGQHDLGCLQPLIFLGGVEPRVQAQRVHHTANGSRWLVTYDFLGLFW